MEQLVGLVCFLALLGGAYVVVSTYRVTRDVCKALKEYEEMKREIDE